MKPAEKHDFIHYPRNRLSRRDLEQIYAMFEDVVTDKPKLIVGEYELSGLEYLDRLDEDRTSTVEIRGTIKAEQGLSISVSVNFSSRGAYFFSWNLSDVRARGLGERIGDLVRERRPWWGFLIQPVPSIFSVTFVSVYLVLSRTWVRSNLALALAVYSVFVLWMVWSLRMDSRGYSMVYISGRPRGFFSRNKDLLIVGLIVAVVSVVLTLLLQRILGGS